MNMLLYLCVPKSSSSTPPVFRLVYMGTAILMFTIRSHYVRENLWFLGVDRKPNKEQCSEGAGRSTFSLRTCC